MFSTFLSLIFWAFLRFFLVQIAGHAQLSLQVMERAESCLDSILMGTDAKLHEQVGEDLAFRVGPDLVFLAGCRISGRIIRHALTDNPLMLCRMPDV